MLHHRRPVIRARRRRPAQAGAAPSPATGLSQRNTPTRGAGQTNPMGREARDWGLEIADWGFQTLGPRVSNEPNCSRREARDWRFAAGECDKRSQFPCSGAGNEDRAKRHRWIGRSRLPRRFAPRNDTRGHRPTRVKRTQFAAASARGAGPALRHGEQAENVKRTQFARLSAGLGRPSLGNSKHEARNSKQIRNTNDRNKPEYAKRTQSGRRGDCDWGLGIRGGGGFKCRGAE